MIMDITLSPVLLNVSDSASLTCMAMGGPRLVLTWRRRDGTVVTTGKMGLDTLTHNITITSDDDFGNYTCNAVIDGMEMIQSVLVVGMYISLMVYCIIYMYCEPTYSQRSCDGWL